MKGEYLKEKVKINFSKFLNFGNFEKLILPFLHQNPDLAHKKKLKKISCVVPLSWKVWLAIWLLIFFVSIVVRMKILLFRKKYKKWQSYLNRNGPLSCLCDIWFQIPFYLFFYFNMLISFLFFWSSSSCHPLYPLLLFFLFCSHSMKQSPFRNLRFGYKRKKMKYKRKL